MIKQSNIKSKFPRKVSIKIKTGEDRIANSFNKYFAEIDSSLAKNIPDPWKMPVFGVFLVCISPYLDWIQRDTLHFFAFSPNTEKVRTRKTPNTGTFHAVPSMPFENLLQRVNPTLPSKSLPINELKDVFFLSKNKQKFWHWWNKF